ncbi:PAN domain protein [Cooperia oncophora]
MESLVTAKPLQTNESITILGNSTAPLVSAIRVFYPIVLFMSMISSGETFGRCFNTEKGLSIDGSEYRRLRNMNNRGCALECRDDPSCFAYEWLEESAVCFLKARSLSGDLVRKADAIIGFCLDDGSFCGFRKVLASLEELSGLIKNFHFRRAVSHIPDHSGIGEVRVPPALNSISRSSLLTISVSTCENAKLAVLATHGKNIPEN